MKIAIIRKKYTFHGGAEGFSQELIARLAEEGNEIHIYAMQWQGNPAGNIHFHKVPALTGNSFLRDLSFAVSSLFLLKKESFDIVQSHDKTLYQDIYRAGDGCHIEWLKQRWLRTGLAGKLSISLNPYHWLVLCLERMIFRGHRYRKILAISDLVKKNIMDNYGVPASDIEVIYNGVDLERFSPDNRLKYRAITRKQHGLSESELVLLFVGSGFERKGVKYLIQAAGALSVPVSVLVVGKGPKEKFEKTGRGQKIVFCGPQKEVEKYYAAADIFVFPTIYEPFGNVHLEALASGLPVITTRNSGGAEIIRDGVNGFVVGRPEDYFAIAEKIGVLADARVREIMSLEARSAAERFTFQRYTAEIMKLYNGVIAERGKESTGR